MRWQPIETAPKDGTAILLASKKRMADGFWKDQTEYGNPCWVWPFIHVEPTHWMPLMPFPEAPNAGVTGLAPKEDITK
jgi:hypothetical protein